MNYKYSLDNKLYKKEINYFVENNTSSRNSRRNRYLISLTVGTIALVAILIRRISENKYNDDIMYILLQHIIIFILVAIPLWAYGKVNSKFTLNKVLLKYWKKEYVHELDIKDEKIYYSGTNSIKIELNNILKEVVNLDNIIGIVLRGNEKSTKKNFINDPFSIIIVPKNIFKSKEELSKFENLLENKLEKL